MPGRQATSKAAYPEPSRRPQVEAMRRAQIIAAARACIAEKGYDATTIRDVAVAGGVSTGTVNYYFPNKEALLISALEDRANEFGRDIREAAHAVHDDPFGTLTALVEASVPLPEEAPRAWYIWMEFWGQAYRHAGLGRVHAEIYHHWRRLIARAVSEGIARRQFQPVDPERVARQLAGLIDGLAVHCIVGDPEIPAEEVRRLCYDYLRTVLQPTDEPRDAG